MKTVVFVTLASVLAVAAASLTKKSAAAGSVVGEAGGVEKKEVSSTMCPPGVPVAMCMNDPCEQADCQADIDAECSGYYCGGCGRKWHDDEGNDVTLECEPVVTTTETPSN